MPNIDAERVYCPKRRGEYLEEILDEIAEKFKKDSKITLENALNNNGEFDIDLFSKIFVCLRQMTKKSVKEECKVWNHKRDRHQLKDWDNYKSGSLPNFLTELYIETEKLRNPLGKFNKCSTCNEENKEMKIIEETQKVMDICLDCCDEGKISAEDLARYEKTAKVIDDKPRFPMKKTGILEILDMENAPAWIKLIVVTDFMRRRNMNAFGRELFTKESRSSVKEDIDSAIEKANHYFNLTNEKEHYSKDDFYNEKIAKIAFSTQKMLCDSRWKKEPYQVIHDAMQVAEATAKIENDVRSTVMYAWANHVICRAYACIGDERKRKMFHYNVEGICKIEETYESGLDEYFKNFHLIDGNDTDDDMKVEIQNETLWKLNESHEKMFEKKDGKHVMHHKHEKISGVKSEPWLKHSQEVYELILGKDDANKLIKKSDQGRPVELFKTRREIKSCDYDKSGLFKVLLDLNFNLMRSTLEHLSKVNSMIRLPTKRLVIRDCLLMFSKQVNKNTDERENELIKKYLEDIESLINEKMDSGYFLSNHRADYVRISESLGKIRSPDNRGVFNGKWAAGQINQLMAQEIMSDKAIKLYFPQGKRRLASQPGNN